MVRLTRTSTRTYNRFAHANCAVYSPTRLSCVYCAVICLYSAAAASAAAAVASQCAAVRHSGTLRLILTRIQCRTSVFGQNANLVRVNRNRRLLRNRIGDGARVISLFACVTRHLGLWTQEIQANADYCYVWRREETCRVCFGLKHPSLRFFTLISRRRDVPRRFTWYFLQPSIRAQQDDLV